jgi:hypothetical protein
MPLQIVPFAEASLLLTLQIDMHPPTVASFLLNKARLLQPAATNRFSVEKEKGVSSKLTTSESLLLVLLLQF